MCPDRVAEPFAEAGSASLVFACDARADRHLTASAAVHLSHAGRSSAITLVYEEVMTKRCHW
jgi:hypothetical protein